jgi:hypothetical protein
LIHTDPNIACPDRFAANNRTPDLDFNHDSSPDLTKEHSAPQTADASQARLVIKNTFVHLINQDFPSNIYRLALLRSLHIAIHGFVWEKYTKPAHEHNLQALPVPAASLHLCQHDKNEKKYYYRSTGGYSA